MHVSPAKQIYKCFSCGAGGDVFSFVMNYHKLTFPEALKYLAELAGIKLTPFRTAPTADANTPQQPTDRQLIAEANKKALAFFCQTLTDSVGGATARDYIEHRGFNKKMVESFQIGCAPEGWDSLVIEAKRSDASLRPFELAGLISPRSGGNGYYDRFRNRLIFPICDTLGRPIAFGGRKLNPQDEPKYLNSPETAVFHKSSTLFALHLAKRAIMDSGQAVIVEGYTDVIACHQAGFKNVVATLGTALTQQHAETLSRLCDRVVLVFDADEAGVKAADRAVEVFLTGNLDVSVATLPKDQDPADLFAQPRGQNLWQETIDSSVDALSYKLDQVRYRLETTESLAGRERMAQEYIGQLKKLGLDHWMRRTSLTGRALALQRLGDVLDMNSHSLESLLREIASPKVPKFESSSDKKATNRVDNPASAVALPQDASKIKAQQTAERHLIGCLLQRPELFHLTLSCGKPLDEALTGCELFYSQSRSLYKKIYDLLCNNRPVSISGLLAEVAAENRQELADWATEADREVEQGSNGAVERIEAMLKDAADWILATEHERRYKQQRGLALGHTETDSAENEENNPSAIWRQMMEHRRANASPLRIADLHQTGHRRA